MMDMYRKTRACTTRADFAPETLGNHGDMTSEQLVAYIEKIANGFGSGAVFVENQAALDAVLVASTGGLTNVRIGVWVVFHSIEPTMWAICEHEDDVQGVSRVLAARRPKLQVDMEVRIVRPQDGARMTGHLPMRHDIHDTILSGVDMSGTIKRIENHLHRHLDEIVEQLGGKPPCVLCGARVDVGATTTELQIVPDDVPFLEVTLRRKCTACANAGPTSAIIMGSTEDERDSLRDAFRQHQLACVRTRAAVRVAAAKQNPAALIAALEEALKPTLNVRHSGDLHGDLHADLTPAAHALVALVPGAPQIARRARALLKSVPSWPQLPEDETRRCAACDVSKPVTEYSANQWRKGNRRCRECQTGNVARDASAHMRARADADALATAFEELALRERTRLAEELARRNENEHTDSECVICFQETPDGERDVLHGAHWVCLACSADMRAHGIEQCPLCRETVTA